MAGAGARSGRSAAGPLAVALGAVASAGVLLFVDPSEPGSWLPRCPFHALTGLNCPGCGGTRMAHALLHGDLAAAFGFNALLLVVGLPLLAWLWVRWLRAARRGERTPQVPRAVVVPALVVAVGWTVVRNLAGW
ncbi:DUF2752 domain-containing protein [Umezawaea beigongshangensis]|uniref:DUF2752 domain-containing protein n=1 Tax=Umezawaea beigongshangensis TaxID=2780383 RepID=UPI0018F165B9|nr:DUF2752 domain-containing protein [Umezawaea beigongshangensis]